jgi:uncharacterized membrane protein YgcG
MHCHKHATFHGSCHDCQEARQRHISARAAVDSSLPFDTNMIVAQAIMDSSSTDASSPDSTGFSSDSFSGGGSDGGGAGGDW